MRRPPSALPARLLRPVLALLAVVALTAGPAVAATGPDVSRYQHPSSSPVDWVAVAASGSSFTFIKATEGTDVSNAWFAGDWADSGAAGLFHGAYHFARPSTSPDSGAAQAERFAAAIGDQSVPGTLPPVLDLETSGGLTRTQLVAWTHAFLDRLQALTGRQPVIYTYPAFWQASMGGTAEFAGYPLWIAHYTGSASPTHTGWGDWAFWQYSATATVAGIRGPVDMNRFRGTTAELAALALATPAGAPPTLPTGASAVPVGLSPGALATTSDTLPGRWTPLAPSRVLDTRTGTGARPGRVSGALTLALPASVPVTAAGVVLSVSAVSPRGAGYVRAATSAQAPATTALNYAGRAGATGLVVSRPDPSGTLRLTVSGAATHLVADLVGYYDTADGSGGHWTAATPTRVVDTRTGVGARRGAVAGDLTVTLPASVPADARGAVLNVSVVDAVHDTFVQVGAAGSAARATVLNVAGGTSRTGLVVAAPGRGGAVVVSVHGGPAQVVVDLLGSYDAGSSSGERYLGTAPVRVVDTRSGLGGAHGSRSVTVALPASVPPGSTAVLDVSAVDPTGTGYLRVAPAGATATTTALNHSRGAAQTGLVLSRTDASGRITLTVSGATTDLVVDLVGHTAPAGP